MELRPSEIQKLDAILGYDENKLIGKSLTLYDNKRQYTKLSLSNLLHFFKGTFNKDDVAEEIVTFLSSERVKTYLNENSEKKTRASTSISLLNDKFSRKNVSTLKKTNTLFRTTVAEPKKEVVAESQTEPSSSPRAASPRSRMDQDTRRTILDRLDLPTSIPSLAQRKLIARLSRAYPEMHITKELGEGGFSTAYLFTSTKDGNPTKQVLKLSSWETVEDGLSAYEINSRRFGGEALALLNFNKNVIKTTAAIAFDNQNQKFVIISSRQFRKFYENPALLQGKSYTIVGTISEYMEGSQTIDYTEKFTDKQIRSIAKQILTGIQALHKQKIVHFDIKPDNVLIAKKEGRIWLKLIDLGLAEDIREGNTPGFTGGTVTHMPTKNIVNEKHRAGTKTDMYSIGMLLYNIATRELIGETYDDLITYHAQRMEDKKGLGDHPNVRRLPNKKLVDLIAKLGAFESRNRPSAEQALQHPFIAGRRAPVVNGA